MLETGVGPRPQHRAGDAPGFTLPGDISASDRTTPRTSSIRRSTVTAQGTILVPKGPGIGYNVVEKRLTRYCVRREYVLS
jgi:O-succinylbenzoate synthase